MRSTGYLLMALGRPDIWPAGDLALVAAARDLKGLESTPTPAEFHALGEPWKPWPSRRRPSLFLTAGSAAFAVRKNGNQHASASTGFDQGSTVTK